MSDTNHPLAHVFKAYDIRGCARNELTEDFAVALGRGIGQTLAARTALIGHDARLSSPKLARALCQGLQNCGVRVFSLGMCGTEELYFASAHGDFDAAVMVTGSHNPAHENGFKLMRGRAIAVSSASGLKAIEQATRANLGHAPDRLPSGDAEYYGHSRQAHQRWLLQYSGLGNMPKSHMKVLVDGGNGCAGLLLQGVIPDLPFEVITRHTRPDGCFPHGVPNPLLPERREATAQAVRDAGADLGVAFDGDFDRCFFFDGAGRMAEACYLIGPMASHLLRTAPGAAIIHDARVYWLIRELICKAGGRPVMARGGHSLMKEAMRRENALFGGEMSAHYFFRDFSWCDGGMLTFCILASLLLRENLTLQELIAQGQERYPVSGEINFRVASVPEALNSLWDKYAPIANRGDKLDGINLEFANWRFNLRGSNTEPLLRLNVESRGDANLLAEMTGHLREDIAPFQI